MVGEQIDYTPRWPGVGSPYSLGFTPFRRIYDRVVAKLGKPLVVLTIAIGLVASLAVPVSATSRTYDPPGECYDWKLSGFEYYALGSSSVRDQRGNCGWHQPQVTWNSYLQGTNRTYCDGTYTDYKRCTGAGDWLIAHGKSEHYDHWQNLYK